MSLLTHDQLVFQQTRNLVHNDFAIMDTTGQQVAHVETNGGTLSRLFAGSRELTVFDGPGNPLFKVVDPMDFGRDRYEILDLNGQPLAHLTKQIRFFKTEVSIEIAGEEISLEGGVWDYNFSFQGQHGLMATVSRQWSGLGNAFMGMSTYLLSLAPLLNAQQRTAVIGSLIALDLIREKRSNN